MNIRAFTLVELIVVITILAILGTIAFVSFQGYNKNSRDTVRISDMKNISNFLEIDLTKRGVTYMPEDYIEVSYSGELLMYQGNIGESILKNIGIMNGGYDPLDKNWFTYLVTKDLRKYQLLGFYEQKDGFSLNINKTFAYNYTNRFPVVRGNNLGVIIQTGSMSPFQNSGNNIDIKTATDSYIMMLNNKTSLYGTGTELSKAYNVIKYGNHNSCNSYLKSSDGLKDKDGNYLLLDNNGNFFESYCDMTTDGGGWTQVYQSSLDYLDYDLGSSDWNSIEDGNYSYLYSFKDIKSKENYEFYVIDDENKSIQFTQPTSYNQDPTGVQMEIVNQNGFTFNSSPQAGWVAFGLGKYGMHQMIYNCNLTLNYGQSNTNWWGCIQDTDSGNWGVAPWSRNDNYVDQIKIFQR